MKEKTTTNILRMNPRIFLIWIFMISISMIFVSLISAYIVKKGEPGESLPSAFFNWLNNSSDKLLKHINENPKHFFAPLGKSRKKIERDLRKQGKE